MVIGFFFRVVEVVYFILAGLIIRLVTMVMTADSLIGGLFGRKMSETVNPTVLRQIVVVIGIDMVMV